MHLLDLASGIVLAALQRLRQSLKNPPIAIENYLTMFEQHELSSFVAKMREFQASSEAPSTDVLATTFSRMSQPHTSREPSAVLISFGAVRTRALSQIVDQA